MQFHVVRKRLENGLEVLVVPHTIVPKVSMQLWYRVGSRDERAGQYGIAHLIEHMIFKGTKQLSESDINVLTHRLSGSCNAFTSYDYTGYLFDTPAQHWHEFFPVFADCMTSVSFKQEHLNSELKAVVQEIKMYNDDYFSTLVERMMSAIFPDHPYGRPIIGYKQDLWKLSSDELRAFYKTFYAPNNATLVVVGAVDADEVFAQAEKSFGHIPSHAVERPELYHSYDMVATNTTIYREIEQPLQLFAWIVPGVEAKKEYLLDLISWMLGAGRGCRLYQKLVVELGLATEVQSFVHDLFQHGVFFLYVQPISHEAMAQIAQIVQEEIERFVSQGFTDQELARAVRKTEVDFLSLGENGHKVASLLGKMFTATQDETYLENYLAYPQDQVRSDIMTLCRNAFSAKMVHTGAVLPLGAEDTTLWMQRQVVSDAEDARILGTIGREAEVEEARYALSVEPKPAPKFSYPIADEFMLSNGIKVFAYHRADIGKIDCILDLKAKHYYDAPDKQGMYMMMADLLEEGTLHRTGSQIAQTLESMGMEFNAFPGQFGFSMLARDAQQGFALFRELLLEPAFADDSIERVREQMLAQLQLFWDTPSEFVGQVAREQVYQRHPYAQNSMGTKAAITALSKEDILAAYQAYMSPQGARLAVVGDFSEIDLPALLEETFGSWRGTEVADFVFPPIAPVAAREHVVDRARDQYVLAYAGLSVQRRDTRFDALLLFDQIFSGGVLGSMSSRLFALRESSGLFYSISGSLLAGASQEPGMVFIKSYISGDRLKEAEQKIIEVMAAGALTVTDEELEEARRALVNSYVDNFASQKQTAATFLLLDRYGFPKDYYQNRAEQLALVSRQNVVAAVAEVLRPDELVTIRVGRF